MRNRLSFALLLITALAAPLTAVVAAPARAPYGTFLDYYDRLPGKHFAAFGGVNRRSLLKRKGAVVDYKNKFIQIPGSTDSRNGDLHLLQIKLFPNRANISWLAVSHVMWNQNRRPGTLVFYQANSDSDSRDLLEAPVDFFPYKLQKTSIAYENAYLPRRGLTIEFRIPESDSGGFNFTYNINAKDDKNFWIKTVTAPN